MRGERNGEFLRFCRRVGVIAGAILAAGTILSAVSVFAWQTAIRPVTEALREERTARVYADSLIVVEMRAMTKWQERIALALLYPPGSPERERILTGQQDADEKRRR